MNYAKKTCNICGYRDIQPNMYRVEKDVYVGSGNTGLSGRTWLGAAIGYKKSQRQIGKYFLAPNKRNYTRRREVWMCGNCADENTPGEMSEGAAYAVLGGFLLVIIAVFSLLTNTNFFDNVLGVATFCGNVIRFFIEIFTSIIE